MKKPNEAQYKSAMKKIVSASGLPVKLGVFGEYFYDRFSNTMPPISFTGSSVLTSEPYGFNDNWEDTYLGFFEKSGKWYGVLTTRKEWIAKSFKKHKDPTGLNAPKKLATLKTENNNKMKAKTTKDKIPYDQKLIDAIAGRLLADDLTPSKFTKKAAL